MLVVWGRNNSVNVQKVLWCCEEMALAYERIDAGLAFGVVDTPQYRSLNPNGLVPTIDDEGFILWESNAIVRYLAAKHAAGTLWPADLKIRAEADRWMDWNNTTFWPAIRPLFHGLVRTAPDKRDPQALEDARLKTAEARSHRGRKPADARDIWQGIHSRWATSSSAARSGAGSRYRSSVRPCRTCSGGATRSPGDCPTRRSS